MPPGIRATVVFSDPGVCPIAELAHETGETIDAVSVTVCPGGCEECVTEFAVDAAIDPGARFSRIFSDGSIQRLRLAHDAEAGCPCECLGRLGCPVARYRASEDGLSIGFYATDYEQLRDIVAAFRERFSEVDIRRFVRSTSDGESSNRVAVDMSRLTDRQHEVLETAYRMGYFERPRETNATEVASALGVDPSTFSEHLAVAESKLLEDAL